MDSFTLVTDRRPTTFVSAGEVSRNFGLWQDRAGAGPVVVTHHGRPRVVMTSAEYFDMSGEDVEGDGAVTDQSPILLNHITEAFLALDGELRIVEVNSAFEAYVGRPAGKLLDRPWTQVFPEVAGSRQEEFCYRVIRTGEAQRVELGCPVLRGRVFGLRAFPYRDGVGLLLRDTTRYVEAGHRASEAAALSEAISAMPGLSAAVLDQRGVLTHADAPFCALTGFSRDELSRFRLADVVLPRCRPALLDVMEAVLTGGAAANLSTAVLNRDGSERLVRFSLAAIHHDGQIDGLRLCAMLLSD